MWTCTTRVPVLCIAISIRVHVYYTCIHMTCVLDSSTIAAMPYGHIAILQYVLLVLHCNSSEKSKNLNRRVQYIAILQYSIAAINMAYLYRYRYLIAHGRVQYGTRVCYQYGTGIEYCNSNATGTRVCTHVYKILE